MDLPSLRTVIDGIDREIVALLVRRMSICADIAAYKKENGLPVLDRSRETALLDRVAALSGDFPTYTRAVYEEILRQSRAYQQTRLGQ